VCVYMCVEERAFSEFVSLSLSHQETKERKKMHKKKEKKKRIVDGLCGWLGAFFCITSLWRSRPPNPLFVFVCFFLLFLSSVPFFVLRYLGQLRK
jgi:hypothetical protein